MLLWWRLREESGDKKSNRQNGILAQEEEAKEIKPHKSTYLPSDEHLSASFIFPQHLQSVIPPSHVLLLGKRMTHAQNHQNHQ